MRPRLTEQSERKSVAEFTLDILPMAKLYFTYILRCNNGMRYFGHTHNLKNRLKDHMKGLRELAELLLDKEVIFSEDLERIFGKKYRNGKENGKNKISLKRNNDGS